MRIKECKCYREALSRFLDTKMASLTAELETEVKKVLGLNFLGLQDQYLTNTNINKILKERSGRFISAFIAKNNPVIIKEENRVVLHVAGCDLIKEKTRETREEEYQVPINE
ncbi:MAG: hypothetical protein ACTSRW_01090 [Candidatus Helarchaeota archaeon]